MDSHAHLQHVRFDADREAVLDRARAAGIDRILVPGWDIPSSEAALELAARNPDLVDAAVGVHPHDAGTMDEAGWAQLEALAGDPLACAIGEIGLDHVRERSPREAQQSAFARQLALAEARGLPVAVHDRGAHEEVMAALLAWRGRTGHPVRGVLHAFSGDAPMAGRLAEAGFIVSFALPLAFRSAAGPRAAATALPEGRFVVETDAPYLGPDRERRNEPTTALRVVAELAHLRGRTAADLVAPIRSAYRGLVDR